VASSQETDMPALGTSHPGYGGNPLRTDRAESRRTQTRLAASKPASFPARLSSWLSAKAPHPRAESSLLPSDAAADLVSEAIALGEDQHHVLHNLGLSSNDLLPTARFAADAPHPARPGNSGMGSSVRELSLIFKPQRVVVARQQDPLQTRLPLDPQLLPERPIACVIWL
jgi:hypothetical protein